jgi:alkanesulfonate monooxygenase SsuD/methylene tetrahydromethanopterin reductase-like flavin-dependent oxidoreductase (luciferase family)
MEFGTLVPQGWRYDLMGVDGAPAKWETFRRVSRGLDEAGWDSLWVWDHFHTFPKKHVETTFEAWTQMATLAEITSRARIGQIVTCMQYREPAYLAKVSACVDVASGGRLNVGVGSGWFEEEFQAYGYDFRTVGQRLRRLNEAIQVLDLMWTEDYASFEGKHYRLKEAVCGSIDEFDEYVEILKGHCKDVGRDFDEIRITAMGGGICYDNDDELDGFFESIAAQGMPRDRLLDFISCKGSREQCAEFLSRWKSKGCDGIVFYFNDIASFGSGCSQAEIFKKDVFPLL